MGVVPAPTDLAGMRVVVWGIGSHGGGVAAAAYCHALGARVAIVDARPPGDLPAALAHVARYGWPWHLGQTRHPALTRADLIVVSPAIPPHRLAELPAQHPPVVVAEALFFAHHRGPRIAVTGTKGKSTTANAVGVLLDWPVAGNSHRPLLDLLRSQGPDLPVVCELSSFQLWHLRDLAPPLDAAIITNIACDHLDWHEDETHYRTAKLRILEWTDTIIVNDHDADILPEGCRARRPQHCTVTYRDGSFRYADGRHLCAGATCHLPGDHNAHNAALALTAAIHTGLDPAIAAIRLANLRPLPHRLETVRNNGDIRFVDDSIATTPTATAAALEAIDGPLAVILGGADKGSDFTHLCHLVARRKAFGICMGTTGARLHDELHRAGARSELVHDLRAAVSRAMIHLDGTAGTVLLSPACASTDQFHDFVHRGQTFADLAHELAPDGPQMATRALLRVDQ